MGKRTIHDTKKRETRIPKTFGERRRELIGALDNIQRSITTFQQSRQVHHLRELARELRALLIYKPKSRNFAHPLLIELAAEKKFPLNIYVSRFAFLREQEANRQTGPKPTFSYGEDMFRLDSTPFHVEVALEQAIKLPYIVVQSRKLSLEDIISLVADTEAAHYDPERPEELTWLNDVEILGVPGAYMALCELGSVVYALGKRFTLSVG